MARDLKALRIFVASPSDVADERNRLAGVVDSMNRIGGTAERLGITLKLLRWETDVAPDAGFPQKVVFDQLPPEDWDIFIGILWLRFGSETGEIDPDTSLPYRSGTEAEFKAAYRCWQATTTGWPKVMFYRCIRPPADLLHFDTAQFNLVQQFFRDLGPNGSHPAFVNRYKQPEEFERLIRNDLEKWVWEYGDQHGLSHRPEISTSSVAQMIPKEDLRKNIESYLCYLKECYQYLDFKGMGVTDRVAVKLPLVEMHVPLKAHIELPKGETWARELRLSGRKVSMEEADAMGHHLSEPRSVLDLVRQYDGLIILGDPGSGKTTFLKYVALRLALREEELLGLGQRLPFLLPLSAYANALTNENIPLDRFIAEYYRERGIDLPIAQMLGKALTQGRAILLLDGIDEVRDLAQRHLVVRRVTDFFAFHHRKGNKFILTSRIVGYREVRPLVEGIVECTLTDFEEKDIEDFVDKWTKALERAARGDTSLAAQEASREREELLGAVHRNPGVKKLAANPLLLTILSLMKRQGVVLPERRVELYQKYIETLLKWWNLARGLDRPPTRDLDVMETTRVLAPLALWMHETSPSVGLVKREDLRRNLEEIYTNRGIPNPEVAATQLLADVHEYASLLLERGPGEYGFIHLTFQEYLAAMAIAQRGQKDIFPVVDALADRVGDDNWYEVALLTIGYMGIVQQRDEAASAILLELIKRGPGESGEAVILAGEAVIDAWPGGVTTSCKAAIVQILQETIADDVRVKPHSRAAAGRALAKLGDPRLEVMTVERMKFCFVPAGPFWMGSEEYNDEKPLHLNKYLDYDFWISRYPITNAQFQLFVEAGGYNEKHWWTYDGGVTGRKKV